MSSSVWWTLEIATGFDKHEDELLVDAYLADENRRRYKRPSMDRKLYQQRSLAAYFLSSVDFRKQYNQRSSLRPNFRPVTANANPLYDY